MNTNGAYHNMAETSVNHPSLTRYAWLSIAAAVLTIGLKSGAYLLTGSVGLLSDALESGVNLAAALVALLALRLAARPANDEFAFGYSKVEYIASGFEGGLILLASALIVMRAAPRLIHPAPIEQLGLGLAISVLAALINLGVALALLRAGKEFDSITLEADARHLLTDVWTTFGVVVGLGLVWLTGYQRLDGIIALLVAANLLYTGYQRLDSIIALLVAANILYTGYRLLLRSGRGLLDISMPAEELAQVKDILNSYQQEGIRYHALRSRQAARRNFMVVHLLVPGSWSVQRGHELAEEVEARVRQAVPNTNVVTHVEPAEDPVSLHDEAIDR